MTKHSRRSIVKSALALLATPLTAVVAATRSIKKRALADKSGMAFIRDETAGEITWLFLCPTVEDWEDLKRDDPYLKSFHTARFGPLVVATWTTNTVEMLHTLGVTDPDRWRGQAKTLASLKRQLDWMQSPRVLRLLEA
jgi:hypothetical protein